MSGNAHAGHGNHAQAGLPGGLQVSERGYTLVPAGNPVEAGARSDFRFRITGPDGQPVTRYDVQHDKELHLIVARRDLSDFRHVHPVLGADGTWAIPLTFATAGDYRVFADFAPSGDPAGPLTLGADVAVSGVYRPTPLPAASRTAEVDGYTVVLDGDLSAETGTVITLSVHKDGRPVTDLEPYLGAFGHLVALRLGDLAYLHVHPQGEPGDGVTPAGPGIGFHTQAPSTGTYRLYLDFQHDGVVRTAEFTVVVAAPQPTAHDAHTAYAAHTNHTGHAGHEGHAAHNTPAGHAGLASHTDHAGHAAHGNHAGHHH
ncbi:hypothetical protein [Yinghuangia aomiensis]|uniref:hypothetical protein n=1 Tax=Yinghuangia aomiensis TaxID=676205 RepID=UPI0031E96547